MPQVGRDASSGLSLFLRSRGLRTGPCLARGCGIYTGMGRMLVGIGLLLVVVGLLVMGLGRLGLPFGRLPGDVSYRGRNFQIFAPLGTSLLLSILLSLLLYVISRFRR